MISHELRCVFLHPQKCGGKAVERALFGVEPAPYSAEGNAGFNLDPAGVHQLELLYITTGEPPWDKEGYQVGYRVADVEQAAEVRAIIRSKRSVRGADLDFRDGRG